MDPIYLPNVLPATVSETWGFAATEDQNYFDALPEEKQLAILADCTDDEQFREKVRISRLCH